MRVFLDTNVLVSAFATRGLCADLIRHVLAEHDLLTGEVNLIEIRRVLRERIRLPGELVESVEEFLRGHEIIAKPRDALDLPVRDPDDALVLASAVAGNADVLVTGDKDLLELHDPPIPILDPRGFWERSRRRRRRAKPR